MTPTRRDVLLGLMTTGLAAPVAAAPSARLIASRWARFGGGGDPDHGAWDAILRRAVRRGPDGIARFDYGNTPLAAVEGYVAGLAKVDPAALSQTAAFAYWVNLYNAVTVRTILERYPVRSIRDIGGGLFSGGPWRDKRVTVMGEALSLDDIEHGILRPVWRDARVHYAVNCASLGCPDIADRAFTADRLAAMLDAGARAYVNHPRGARVDGDRLVVSSIYDWYKGDFGGTDAGVIAHLAGHADADLAARLKDFAQVSDFGYDWRLNG